MLRKADCVKLNLKNKMYRQIKKIKGPVKTTKDEKRKRVIRKTEEKRDRKKGRNGI